MLPPGAGSPRPKRTRAPPTSVSCATSPDLRARLAGAWNATFLPDHIPKSTRRAVATSFMNKVQNVLDNCAHVTLFELFMFSFRVLGQPKSAPANRKLSLPQVIRRNLQSQEHPDLEGDPKV